MKKTALKYLSRYLYRGVISEKNIVSNQNGQVTFKYIESKTGNTLYRTLKGEDFYTISHPQRGGFFAPHLTTCATKRITKSQGLWVSSW
ncbi:MAG: transposase [Deltaproteobacteria bacterium]|nr:transposase [Deltaproteobacteria bacterium]